MVVNWRRTYSGTSATLIKRGFQCPVGYLPTSVGRLVPAIDAPYLQCIRGSY